MLDMGFWKLHARRMRSCTTLLMKGTGPRGARNVAFHAPHTSECQSQALDPGLVDAQRSRRPQPCCVPHLSEPGGDGGDPGPTPPPTAADTTPQFPRPRSRPHSQSRTPKRRARRGAGRGPPRLRTPSGLGVPGTQPT